MITVDQYFGSKEHTPEQRANAEALLLKVNSMVDAFEAETGRKIKNDPDTGTQISGAKGGSGDGGFRLPDSSTGKPTSTHKKAKGVDVFDEGDHFDFWITRNKLIKFGLYREAAPFTPGWCHLQDVAPGSGNRSYIP